MSTVRDSEIYSPRAKGKTHLCSAYLKMSYDMIVATGAITVFPSFPDGKRLEDQWVFVLDRVLCFRSSFLGLRFRHIRDLKFK